MEQIIHTVLEVGLEKPIKLLHITDVHLTDSDEHDPESQRELLKKRTNTFFREGGELPHGPEHYFKEAIALADELGATLVVTGDVIDLHSHGNVESFRRIIGDHDMMFTPGGHETQRVCKRTMEEGPEYVAELRRQLAEEFPSHDLDFESRIIGGVNVITANNALDYYNAYTVARFEEEMAKGLPVIVFSHDPVHDRYMQFTESYHPNVTLTKEDYEISHRMLDRLLHDPQVITTVAGHWHRNDEREIDGKTHYVTHGLFAGVCRLIEIR